MENFKLEIYKRLLAISAIPVIVAFALLHMCDESCKESSAKYKQEEAKKEAKLEREATTNERRQKYEREQAELKRQAETVDEEKRLSQLKSTERSKLLKACFDSDYDCPLHSKINYNMVISSAPEKEQKELEAKWERWTKVQDDANRSLRCCDGECSDTCTVSSGRRGCCSSHGGVCGICD